MEKTLVTFTNLETNQSINISLSYDKKNSDLNYVLDMGEYKEKLSENMDLTGFLANMFLNTLQADK